MDQGERSATSRGASSSRCTWPLFAIVLAVILALFGALGRLSKNPVAYGLTGFYTSFFRGTPLIVQLFLIYLALPQIGQSFGRLSLVNILTFTPFQAGVIGLGSELRRVHDGDLPGRDPIGRARSG